MAKASAARQGSRPRLGRRDVERVVAGERAEERRGVHARADADLAPQELVPERARRPAVAVGGAQDERSTFRGAAAQIDLEGGELDVCCRRGGVRLVERRQQRGGRDRRRRDENTVDARRQRHVKRGRCVGERRAVVVPRWLDTRELRCGISEMLRDAPHSSSRLDGVDGGVGGARTGVGGANAVSATVGGTPITSADAPD